MGKKGLTFTVFAALGAITGYATYMASKDKFSDETKDKYDVFLNKAKNVGTDIQRTYTSIGDKDQFTTSSKNLTESAKKLADKTGDLVISATSDMYKLAKDQITDAFESAKSDVNSFSKNQLKKVKVPAKKNNDKKATNSKKKSSKKK